MARKSLFMSLALVFAAIYTCPPAFAGPMDKIIEFYTSSVPNPPEVKIDVAKVMELAETGDIIIENNVAFPQWYVAIGTFVPNTRFVHAGMIIKGHNLKLLMEKLDPQRKHRNAHTAYVRCLQTNKNKDGKPYKVWEWVRAPIDANAKYVVTPEVTRGHTMSKVVALHLKHYLLDPAVGHSTKHIMVLRPPIKTQQELEKVSMYLAYHVFKCTEYDMGFNIGEPEPMIFRKTREGITADITVAPVPLYCTELLWRALNLIGCETETVLIGGKVGEMLRKVKRLPKSFAEKISTPFVTADTFIRHNQLIYANSPSPSVSEVIKSMKDKTYQSILARFKEAFTGSPVSR